MSESPAARPRRPLRVAAIAGLVLVIALALNQFARGFWSYASMIVAAAIGYFVAFAFGKVDFARAAERGTVTGARLPLLFMR